MNEIQFRFRLRSGQFGKIRNIWKVLKCGFGEEWRSVGQIV
jgi:hypothetical protein